MNYASVTEAAKALGVNKSTISRYVAANPELNHAEAGKPPAVDIDELSAHRGNTVNKLMSGNHASDLIDEGDNDEDKPPQLIGYAKSKAEREAANASMAQLQLAERVGQVCDKAGTEDAAYELGQMLTELLNSRNRRLADELATMADPREIRARLDAEDRDLLGELVIEIHRRLETRNDEAA